MLFTRWFRRRNRPTRTFRPTVLELEGRIVPSGFGHGSKVTGPATTLRVVVPESAQAGQTIEVEVFALDASNHVATSFSDSISLSGSDSTATGTTTHKGTVSSLPLSYTFTTSDHGEHDFFVTLNTPGTQSLTATDVSNASITAGSASLTVNPAATLTSLLVETPEQAVTGTPVRVKVEALDQSGHVLRNFSGTVALTGSDSAATGLPANVTLSHGVGTASVTFGTTGSDSVTATDGSVTDTAVVTVSSPTQVTQLAVFLFPVAVVGTPTTVTVEALNAIGQVVTTNSDPISFGSTDTTAQLPANAALTNGTGSFSVTFETAGLQTLTATDTATPSITGDAFVAVVATPPPKKHHHF